ncbi:NepR family anti-sigma factor [Blastomonas sp.]|uniref:NepR family anti-sigma factor n=1 Tax=Blastomonas sp. TaxID=1909299 RepID=UPI00260B5643|nr:NepR family anti-sigma factor [Blastomonas sp.]MDM7956044.1 NepR family anti-sigma factor [Blastomonas sp.]
MQTSAFDPIVMRQAHIGRSLRQVYNGVTDTPLPDQFESLLDELDKIGATAASR